VSEDLSESIAAAALEPKRVKGDNFEAEAHPLPDQIAADRYAKSNRSASQPLRCIRMTPPGAV
jgi:hypothetical protein